MDTLICFGASLIGCTLLYGISPNQALWEKPLTHPIWRWSTWIIIILSFVLWMNSLEIKAGFFAATVVLFLISGTLPFLSLLVSRKEGNTHGC
ncbi:MAG: hypothetical protein ACI4NJ_05105 [Cellvibrio sp.]